MLYQSSEDNIKPVLQENGRRVAILNKQTLHPVSSQNITCEDFKVQENCHISVIIQKLQRYGVCIVERLIDQNICDDIIKELDPYFFRDESWNGSPFPKETKVVTRSILKSPTSVNNILCNKLFLEVSSRILNESNYFWTGSQLREVKSSIHLNSGITYKVGPNAKDQMYHREDMVHHNVHEERTNYKRGTETLVGLSVGLTHTTRQNGATRVIAGSHLWGSSRIPDGIDHNVCYIELEKGDCAFLLGSTYHAASSNTTLEDRISSFYFMTKSYLKQEENLFLDLNLDHFKTFSTDALKLIGLGLSEPFCGHIDYMNPMELIDDIHRELKSKNAEENKNYSATIDTFFA